MKKIIYLSILVPVLLVAACKKSGNTPGAGPGPDPVPNPGGNNDPVTITGSSPEYVFWGGELTITGTGFSTTKADNFVWLPGDDNCYGTNKKDSTDWKKAEILSATATKLVIKVPYSTNDNGNPCGNDLGARLRLTVKGKKTVESTFPIRTMGVPVPISFCDDYGGGYHASGAVRPGDSALLTLGGSGMINLLNSTNKNKIRLAVGGKSVPVTLKPGVSGCGTWGLTFILPNVEFAEKQCTPINSTWGQAGEMKTFKLFIDESQLEAKKDFFVTNLPKGVITDASGPLGVSKSAGGHPHWVVKGKNMSFRKARFTGTSPSCANSGEFDITCLGYCEEFHVYVPLSLLSVGCSYNISVIDECGQSKHIGGVQINP